MDGSKAWYTSKTVWGGIVAVGAGVAGVFGFTVAPADQEQIVLAATGIAGIIGGLISIWGRVKASKAVK